MTERIRRYEGQAITVTYDRNRCIHVKECVEGLPQVFDRHGKPWVNPEGASADEVATVVLRCPTGALKYERKDGGAAESIPGPTTIAVDRDGPLYAWGEIEIRTADGSFFLKDTRVALCRCGGSKNKPFCDGSHGDIEFADAGSLGRSVLKMEGDSDTPTLRITVAADGPLLLEGPITIVSSNGSDTASGLKGALCRCGSSQNKPYCDGSHKRIEFSSK